MSAENRQTHAKSSLILITLSFCCALLLGMMCITMFPLRDFDPTSDRLVSNSLTLPKDSALRGHLVAGEERTRLRDGLEENQFVARWLNSDGPVPYFKQFGLQVLILDALISPLNPGDDAAVFTARLLMITYHALVFSLLVYGLAKKFGLRVASCFLIITCLWPGFWRWVPSLYWPAGATLAIFAWFLLADPTRKTRFYLIGFTLFLLRFLSGYEFITCISLGSLVMAGLNFWSRGQRLPTGYALRIWGVSVVAFVAAICLHAWRLLSLGGSWSESWDVVAAPAIYRTVGASSLEISLLGTISNNLSVFFQHGTFIVIAAVLIGMPVWVKNGILAEEMKSRCRFALWTVAALGAGLSWQLLAIGHSGLHGHINHVVFIQPFAWVVALWAAMLVSSVSLSSLTKNWREIRSRASIEP